MPLYNSPLPGSNITHIVPGQSMALFDGTDHPVAGLRSIAIHRGHDPLGQPAPQVFTVAFPSTPTATVIIQGWNADIAADYVTLATITTQTGYYADYGEFAFYTAILSAYTSGGMPVVTVN